LNIYNYNSTGYGFKLCSPTAAKLEVSCPVKASLHIKTMYVACKLEICHVLQALMILSLHCASKLDDHQGWVQIVDHASQGDLWKQGATSVAAA
jgi:hypothetical protein